jgi:hypothetical protein
MSQTTTEIPLLVTHSREQYLRKNEVRIRNLALPQHNTDPLVELHLNAVHMAEDLEQIHASAASGYRSLNTAPHRVQIHEHHAAAANQIKLYHLDKLATILL